MAGHCPLVSKATVLHSKPSTLGSVSVLVLTTHLSPLRKLALGCS